MAKRRIRVYSDYKSPYAYLAKDLVYELERETGVTIDWLPYTLDIPAYLGSAQIDSAGNVIEASRNAHQWRRVKYSYMDCRREGLGETLAELPLTGDQVRLFKAQPGRPKVPSASRIAPAALLWLTRMFPQNG